MSGLHATGLARRYGNGRGVGPLDLTVQPGEVVSIQGSSGSGKSTLLAVLGLILTPDRGRLSVAGRRTEKLDDRRRSELRREAVSIITQDHGLLPFLNTWENVAVGLGRDIERHRAAALDVLAALGLADFADRRVTDLSGGERGRVAVARAMARRPGVLLADEPTGNLDPANRDNVTGLLAAAAAAGAAVVVATHDDEVASRGHTRRTLVEGVLQ